MWSRLRLSGDCPRIGCNLSAGRLGDGARRTHSPADQHTKEETDHQDDGGGHKQKDQLLAVQLYLAEAFVTHGLFSTPVSCLSRCIISIGRGKTIVEFFSAAISVSV